jgi:hypothetical protein
MIRKTVRPTTAARRWLWPYPAGAGRQARRLRRGPSAPCPPARTAPASGPWQAGL